MPLDEAGRARVTQAVKKAESGLTAEIVPCVFERSSSYREVVWAGGAASAGLLAVALLLADARRPLWVSPATIMLWLSTAGFAGAALGRWCAPVIRFLAGSARMEDAVARRAKEVFRDRGVARTAGRDGVLIFASLLERRVVVLADEAVWSKTPPGTWDDAVAVMTAAAREACVADGLCAAVEKTASALRAAGFGGKPASGNELGDDPITG